MTNSKPYFELSAADMTSLKAALQQQIGGHDYWDNMEMSSVLITEGNMTPESQ